MASAHASVRGRCLYRNPAWLIGLVLSGAPAARAELRAWTVTETRHVLRSQSPETNLHVRLGAARNEWVSFQVLVRADQPTEIARLDAGDLCGPGETRLRGSEARLYREHQLYLKTGTHRNDDFRPDGYPDPLIPFAPPAGARDLGAARFKAIPFDLPTNETHGFWVDVHVPFDAPAGDYRGAYRLLASGGPSVEIPVTLTVWNFALPETPTLVTEFGSPAHGVRDYSRRLAKEGKAPEPADGSAVEEQCAQLLGEHRFNAPPPEKMLWPAAQTDGSYRVSSEQIRALRAYVDRYHVNAIQVPHAANVVNPPASDPSKLRAWFAALDGMAKDLDRPHILLYTYLRDEPNDAEAYDSVRKWGRAIHDTRTVVKILVVEQTWTEPGMGGADSAWGDLHGAVDIWCPLFSLHRQDSAAQRQALGETIWTYTALCQGKPTPWWHIDFPLLNYRVPAWIAWRYRMKGLLYWGGMSYWKETDDPWLHAPIFTEGKGSGGKGVVFNGEGSLVYPARDAGYDGIVPTIRLKALRDAIEDYEYLAMLDRLGKSAEAETIVRPLAESFFEWEKNPAAFETARSRLASLIAP